MTQPHDFLRDGLALVGNGYEVIPVKAGEKRPGIDAWQTVQATPDLVRQWADNGFEDGNIGILTTKTPAIDLDIYDERMAERMERWCLRELGPALVRVGRAPKRLLLFCCDHPFGKLMATYADERGTKHKIEVLGRGQQFVAFGIHPETKRPFEWKTDSPLLVPSDFLPVITVDQARQVLAQFGEYAREAGWTFVSDNSAMAGQVEDDNALATYRPRLKLTREEAEHALQYVDGAEDYDRWIMVGMALHHQTRGHEAGLEMWKEWSSQAHNYDPKACELRWRKSFSDVPAGHYATTFASVLKIANEAEKKAKADDFSRLLNVMRNSTDEEEILGPIAREIGKAITTDYHLDLAAKRMQDRLHELSEARPRIEVCRKALTAAKNKGEKSRGTPEWCDGWVYVTAADRFFHLAQKTTLTERAFNAKFDREVLSEEDRMQGVATPAARASSLALNVHNIPVVEHTVYLPGFDRQLEIDGRPVANTFDETTIPEAREPRTEEERDAIRKIERHFEVLFPDPRERTLVLDYLAYNVQFPAEKIVWGIVMIGVEGGGKTFISKLMARVLGHRNVGSVAASEIQDKYTGWAEGRKMNFVEEIRLQGHNRYEIIERLKIYLSNDDAPIRKMHMDSYTVPNVTNYVMFTNHWDALPLSLMDRRYFVVSTSFQTKAEIDAWNASHPSYFTELYAAAMEHGDVLRHWFLTRTLSDTFQPKRAAPDSHAKHIMRDVSESSDERDALDQVLADSNLPDVSELLVNADKLRDVMSDAGHMPPYGRAFATLLTKAGFVLLGRFRLDGHGSKLVRFYTRTPNAFRRGHELERIREIIDSAKDPNDPFA